jgi:hypothetical protein
MVTAKKKVCLNQGWIGWKKVLNKFSGIFDHCWAIYTFRIDLDNTSYICYSTVYTRRGWASFDSEFMRPEMWAQIRGLRLKMDCKEKFVKIIH